MVSLQGVRVRPRSNSHIHHQIDELSEQALLHWPETCVQGGRPDENLQKDTWRRFNQRKRLVFITVQNYHDGFSITFSHCFQKSGQPSGGSHPAEETYFAFTYPFTYTDIMNFSEKLEERYAGHKSIYFHREWLVNSL